MLGNVCLQGGRILMITKKFNSTIKGIDKEAKTLQVLVSAYGMDRDREMIDPKAFMDNLNIYKSHPVLLSSHDSNSTLMNQIGEAKSIEVTSDGLVATFEYYTGKGNPEADYAWFLASERKISAFSVGFMPLNVMPEEELPEGARRVFTEVELYEISQVLIPSFRGAIQEDRKLLEDKDFIAVAKAYYGEEVDEVIEETKSGRVLSDKNMKKLNEIHQKIHEATKEFKAFIEETTPIPQNESEEDKQPDETLEIKDVNSVLETLNKIKKNLGGK